MKQQSITGWITRAHKKIIQWFFSSFLGKRLTSKYGVSFDGAITLSDLPVRMPELHGFYAVATDVAYFEVLKTSVESSNVTIREVGTDSEYKIDAALFELLFIQVEKPAISYY